MIWIPIASIVVFVLLFIPTVVLGIKRGWRSALFVSLIFIGLNAAIIGLGMAIYKNLLWDLYQSYFMKQENKIGSINYSLLAPHYEPRVLLIFGGILSPITYGITIGLYFLLKKPLDSYLMPKVKAINAHEKELTYRRKPLVSQISGGVITSVTGLFAASFFASAVNVIVTPRENQNLFNKFNDIVGRIYTFGMAGNTEEVKAISQFLRGVDESFVKNVQNLVEYDVASQTFSKANNALVAAEVDKYKFLYESKDATKAVFDALVANISLANIDVLSLGFDQANDKNANTFGQAQATRKIETLIAFVDSNNILSANLPDEARQALMNRLIAAITGFDKSVYAQQYNQMVSNSNAATRTISDRQNELASVKSDLSRKLNEQDKLVNEIETKAGYSSTTPTTQNAFNVKEFSQTSVDRTLARPGSTIQRETAVETTNKTAMDDAKTIFDNANKAYSDYYNKTFKPADDTKKQKESAVSSQQSFVNSKQNEYDSAVSSYSSRQRERADAQSYFDSVQRRVNELPNLISNAQTIMDSAFTVKSSAELKRNTAYSDQQSAQTYLTDRKNEYSRLKGIYDQAVNDRNAVDPKDPSYAGLDAAVTSARKQMDSAYSLMNDAQRKFDQKSATLNTADNELANANGDYNNKKSAYDSLTSELNQKRSELQRAQDSLDRAKQAEQLARDARDTALSTLSAEKNKLTTLQSDLNTYTSITWTPLNRENDRLKNDSDKKQDFWNAATSTYNNQKNKVDQLISDVNNALQNLKNANTAIISFNQSIARLEARTSQTFNPQVDNATWDKTNSKYDDTSIYAAEQYKAFCELKVSQTLAIKNTMSSEYDNLKAELLNAFRKYTVTN